MKPKHIEAETFLSEPALDDLAEKIRPLPDNVVPSERFLEQMRLRLLDLDAPHAGTRKAA